MTNATMRELYKFLAPRCDYSPRRMELFGRHLREDKLIGAGRPGRGGSTPEASPRSASALLIAVLAGDSAVGAADAVREIGSLKKVKEIKLAGLKNPLGPASTFLDDLAYIIEKMGDRSAHNLLREGISEVAVVSIGGESGASISEKISRNVTKQYYYGDISRGSSTGLARIGSLDGSTLVEIADLLRGHESGPTS